MVTALLTHLYIYMATFCILFCNHPKINWNIYTYLCFTLLHFAIKSAIETRLFGVHCKIYLIQSNFAWKVVQVCSVTNSHFFRFFLVSSLSGLWAFILMIVFRNHQPFFSFCQAVDIVFALVVGACDKLFGKIEVKNGQNHSKITHTKIEKSLIAWIRNGHSWKIISKLLIKLLTKNHS